MDWAPRFMSCMPEETSSASDCRVGAADEAEAFGVAGPLGTKTAAPAFFALNAPRSGLEGRLGPVKAGLPLIGEEKEEAEGVAEEAVAAAEAMLVVAVGEVEPCSKGQPSFSYLQ